MTTQEIVKRYSAAYCAALTGILSRSNLSIEKEDELLKIQERAAELACFHIKDIVELQRTHQKLTSHLNGKD